MEHFSFNTDRFSGRTIISGEADVVDDVMVVQIETPKKNESYYKTLKISFGDNVVVSLEGVYIQDDDLKPLRLIGSLAKQFRLGLLRVIDQDDKDALIAALEDWHEGLGGGDLFLVDEHGDIDCSHEVYFNGCHAIKTPGCAIKVERWTNGWIYNDAISISYVGSNTHTNMTKVYSGETTPPEPTEKYILNLIKQIKEETIVESTGPEIIN